MNPATEFELWLMMDINWSQFKNMKKAVWFRDEWLPRSIHIYHAFEEQAIWLKRNVRRDKYSARVIIGKLRWDTMLADGSKGFKISDHCSPYLARLAMLRVPELKDMFNIAES